MEKLYCTSVSFTSLFDQKTLKIKSFKTDNQNSRYGETDRFVFHFTNKFEHAHLEIALNGEDSFMSVSFHQGPMEEDANVIAGKLVPEVLSAFSKYFSKKIFYSRVTTEFLFGEDFEPLIQLNYPFLIADEAFSGAEITGHEISFPSDSELFDININTFDGMTKIVINAFLGFRLSDFNYHELIQHHKTFTDSLIKQR